MPERTFTCFGGACTVLAEDADAVLATRDEMLAWHDVFSRFKPESELSRLNLDPREVVPVSLMMARFAAAAVAPAEAPGGLAIRPCWRRSLRRATPPTGCEARWRFRWRSR